jgi:hypothetical protein
MNKTINKLIVTGPNYEQFLQDNIIDGKLDFSILVPVPENVTEEYEKLRFAQIDDDELVFIYNMHDNGFHFRNTIGFYMLTNDFDYVGWMHPKNSFHYWSIDIWGPCVNRPEVSIEHIENGAIVRFITIYDGPSKWATSLPESYPELDFHIHSISSRGLYAHDYIKNGEMVCAIDSALTSNHLGLLDCTVKPKEAQASA